MTKLLDCSVFDILLLLLMLKILVTIMPLSMLLCLVAYDSL